MPGAPGTGQVWIEVAHPTAAMTGVCARIEALLWPRPAPGIHPTAVVDVTAEVSPEASIGPLCTIEAGVRVGARAVLEAGVHVGRGSSIGRECWIHPRVVVYRECTIGERVRLHAGVVIGADGFGYEFQGGQHRKIPQVGTVVVEDDVEIGAGSCVDRARFGRTVIGRGTKIDNLVQVGHNVVVGPLCILVAQVGIAGSTVLGTGVIVGGQAGFADHLRIGDGARVAGQSGVARDLAPGETVMGSPAIPVLLEQRFAVLRQRLPEYAKRIDRLESEARGLRGTAA
jgi:UDP-3-O-[3-hydroxymyristoyl] glucosamine N-acyltransferase